MSMFSQSLAMGDETLGELEKADRQQQRPRPPESLEIIDESPTSTSTNHSRLTSMRTQSRSSRTQRGGFKRNKSDSILLKPSEGAVSARPLATNESYSDLFRSNLDFDFDEKNNFETKIDSFAQKENASLDKYFKDSIEFSSLQGTSQRPNTQKKCQSQEDDLGDMFESSNFFSQPIVGNTDEIQLDEAIVADENSDIAWFEELNKTVEQTPKVSGTQAILWEDCSFKIVKSDELPISQNICWEDSGDFNKGIFDVDVQTESDQNIQDEAAVCIDNVTFTQDFLNSSIRDKQRSCKNSRNSQLSNQSLPTDYIHTEMMKCQKQVINGLSGNSQLLGGSFVNLDASSTSNMILNYSAESIPITRSMTESSAKPKETIQEPSIRTLSTNVQRQLPNGKHLNQIDQWGLLPAIVREYHRKGIRTMFDWQVECLSNTKVNTVFTL